MSQSHINLFTTYYDEKNEARKKEYLKAILLNIENPLIKKIYFLHERNCEIPFENEKIESIHIEGRPSFSQFFNTINNHTLAAHINIICNTDIYFNQTIALTRFCRPNEVYSLNRWDVIDENKVSLFAKYLSSDTWIFKGKIKDIEANYFLGQLGCDNKILYDLHKAGYNIKNPALSIHSFHIHASNIRGQYSDPKVNNRIPAPYLYSIPNFLNFNLFLKQFFYTAGPWKIIKMLITRRCIKFQYRYDIKNEQIEHEHQIIGIKNETKIQYWLLHDYFLPLQKLNIFNRKNL